ncbi:MAG: hypothetical protein NT085_02570 [candidate division SR1 bacterium]|nr:hypothetical protein [candidate division SR1 bacterium]
MSEETNKEPITGYFSASKEENLTEGTLVPTGRSGVYHERNTLVSIINAKPVNKANINIVKVKIPVGTAIINPKNNQRFGIKAGKVSVVKVEALERELEVA